MRIVPLMAAAVLGCSSNAIFGIEAIGEDASVVWHRTETAGGQVFEARLAVDSATGRYEIFRCQGPITSQCVATEERSGTVPPAVLVELFERAQSREFRELKTEYPLADDDVIPPDGGWTELTIVVGERRKSVSWDRHASIPQILNDYGCLMLAATESLLCD